MELQWIGYLKQSGWMDLLKIGGVAGLVSSVVSLVWSEVKDGRAHRREARHVALTTALSLEQYAREARLMMHRADWAAHEAARTQSYAPIKKVALPEMTYPESIDWKWLKHKVTSRLREFPASLHSTRQSLSAEWEYGDPIDFCAEVEFESARAAIQALDLSRMTRATHGVAPWIPGAQVSDLEKELRQFIEYQCAKREKIRENRRQLMADLLAENTTMDAFDAQGSGQA
ncbi:MAG TPA: hypothetical protein VJU59_25180 [Paraburkholderia sp.]|uniref:hypothetical protein n=1 Tax=Paraburkholderia sp. TaxID=1926495 RepID=UPI002B47F5B2|nr:hypothetical protein [Paraburkholderia sp.]HKR42932.1 hypothetical protein [Paraburkholderia sp.]